MRILGTVFLVLCSFVAAAQSGPPTLCKPCLFYGGDLNPDDPNAVAFANENTLTTPYTYAYGAVTVPTNRTLLVEGILFQTVMQFDKFDPNGVYWEIRTSIYGTGGNLIASGSRGVAVEPTGRQLNGVPEYTVAVRLVPAVQITGGSKYPGTTYWFNILPQGTNKNDGICKIASYMVSNSTQETNSLHSFAQPVDSIVLDSVPSLQDFVSCTAAGYTGSQCAFLSFGLMGRVLQ
jgi:hypothetical protein